jgi:hypothetical protein
MSTPKTSKVTSASLIKEYSNDKAKYYDLAFENGDKGILSLPATTLPPIAGETIAYILSDVTRKDGSKVSKVEYPLPPSMRPPAEVVAPVSNPVVESKTEPVEVKAPEKAYKAPDRDRFIVRQSCIASAANLVAHMTMDVRNVDTVIEVARRLEEEVYRSVEQ